MSLILVLNESFLSIKSSKLCDYIVIAPCPLVPGLGAAGFRALQAFSSLSRSPSCILSSLSFHYLSLSWLSSLFSNCSSAPLPAPGLFPQSFVLHSHIVQIPQGTSSKPKTPMSSILYVEDPYLHLQAALSAELQNWTPNIFNHRCL